MKQVILSANDTIEVEQELKDVVTELYEIGAIQFGSFKLKSGAESSYYIDLRRAISYPQLLARMSDLMRAKANSLSFNVICGVPYAALALCSGISLRHNLPMIMVRDKVKEHGTKQLVEGVYKENDQALIIEDVITSGESIATTAQTMRSKGLIVKDALVFIDREQKGSQRLESIDIEVHPVLTISQVFSILKSAGNLTANVSKADQNKKTETQSYAKRAEIASHPISCALFRLMEEKQTNLAASADLPNKKELLAFADAVGPSICVLKTHADIIEEFDDAFIQDLQALAEKHHFLIFEDRKFADIGNTVQMQYRGGVHKISSWAHLINAHGLPGPGLIQALQKATDNNRTGLLLISQMSSAGSLTDDFYAQKTLQFAQNHSSFVIGFITQHQLTQDPQFIHFVPGVNLATQGDQLGQQYITPHQAIIQRGADVMIVGRGLYGAKDPGAMAEKYRTVGWDAYKERLES
ncbi:MAG TPA: orotidine-5'-phosphate decarboxylase [Rhabdochlamydiaceae bacterium]|nr:orotidine-5'-phosphate decarboxylase [Rhabdochlamydiaceae bacterium]